MLRFFAVFLFYSLCAGSTGVYAQKQILFTDITLTTLTNSYEGRDQEYAWKENETLEIIDAAGAVVVAKFRTRKVKNRPADKVAQNTRLTILYTCSYLGEQRIERKEKNFKPGQPLQFNDMVTFNFSKSSKPLTIKLKLMTIVNEGDTALPPTNK